MGRRENSLSIFLFFVALWISQVSSQDSEFCAKVCEGLDGYRHQCQTNSFNKTEYYQRAYQVLEKRNQLTFEDFRHQFKEALLTILNNCLYITRNDTVLAQALYRTDEKDYNTITLFYTGQEIEKVTRKGTWDIEHVWAKSYGFNSKNFDASWDLHNLRPCSRSVNRSKGDRFLKEGDKKFCMLPLNAKESQCQVWGNRTKYSIEPPDTYKGDSARILFYMELMYSGKHNLKLVDNPTIKSKDGSFGYKTDLLKWAQKFGVSASEEERNKRIYCLQKNRNPFIDHPEWISDLHNEYTVTPTKNESTRSKLDVVSLAVIITIASVATLFIAGFGYNTYKGEKGLNRLPLYSYVSKYWSKKETMLAV